MLFQKVTGAVIIFLLWYQQALSQGVKQVIFTPEAFVQTIKLYHPVAKQADILVDKAKAELLSAKGAFDPVVVTEAGKKTFDGKNYYYYTNPELKIPTTAGVAIKTGLENNGGDFLTSDITRGKSSYLGAEISLGKGLLIDERRAVLQQARIFRSQSEQERSLVLNDLLFNAYADYWEWAGSYELYSIYSRYVDVAAARLRLVRIAFTNGDRAVMDTIEAFTQLQNYQLQQSGALLNLNNAKVELSNYLWMPEDRPYELPVAYVPDTNRFASTVRPPQLEELLDQSANRNPVLKSYELKLNALEIERRLKFQSLLPTVNVNANLLSKGYYQTKGIDAVMLQNNYKWGIQFKMPLFLREGRGDYLNAQLKIKETNLELSGKRWEIENKIRGYYMQNDLVLQQLQTNREILKNLNSLLRNEELKFAQGESNLFLVNSRETKVLETIEKQIELTVKYIKSGYAIEWAAGLLGR